MEGAERFQEIDEMDQLVNACAVLYQQHLIRYLRHVLGRYFEAGLLRLEKVLYILYFRKLEEGIEIPPGIEKDVEGLYLLTALGCKIRRIAFKDVGEVGSQPVYLVGSESMHIVLRHQGAFSLLDPGELDLFVPVKVGIEMRQHIFLHDDSLVVWNRNSELQYFHIPNIHILRILSRLGQNEEKTG